MKASSSSTISSRSQHSPRFEPITHESQCRPAPLIIQDGDAPTSTKTVTVTPGVVIPGTTITVLSVGIYDNLHTTLSGEAAASYLSSESASLSSKECDDLALHGVQCASVTTVTTTAGMTGDSAAVEGTESVNAEAAGVPLSRFGTLQRVGRGEFRLAPVLEGLAALMLAGVCGVLAFVL